MRWGSIAGVLCGLAVLPAVAAGTFRFGGTARDLAWAATGERDGTLYVVGAFSGRTDFDPATAAATAAESATRKPPPARRLDAYLACYDAKGEFAWVVTMGGSGTNLATSVATGGDGAICVGGSFEGRVDFDRSDPQDEEDTLATRRGRDAFLACYGAEGEFLWVRGFGDEDRAPAGDKRPDVEFSEAIRGVALDAEGNVYAVGMFSGLLDLDPGEGVVERRSAGESRDIFVVSLDRRGAFRWGLTLGGSGLDQGHAVALTPDEGLVIGGCFSEVVDFDPRGGVEHGVASGGQDAFVAWYGREGAFRRLVTFGAAGTDQVASSGLAVDASGAVHVAGDFRGTVDVDPGRKRMELRAEDGSDAFLVRYDEEGRPEWAIALGGAGEDSAHAVCLGPKGDVGITGRFQGSVDFDPARRRVDLEAPGSEGATAAYVALYTKRGKLRWARGLGAPVQGTRMLTRGTGLVSRADGGLTAVGTFYGNIDVDASRKTRMLMNLGDADVFVVRYDARGAPLP